MSGMSDDTTPPTGPLVSLDLAERLRADSTVIAGLRVDPVYESLRGDWDRIVFDLLAAAELVDLSNEPPAPVNTPDIRNIAMEERVEQALNAWGGEYDSVAPDQVLEALRDAGLEVVDTSSVDDASLGARLRTAQSVLSSLPQDKPIEDLRVAWDRIIRDIGAAAAVADAAQRQAEAVVVRPLRAETWDRPVTPEEIEEGASPGSHRYFWRVRHTNGNTMGDGGEAYNSARDRDHALGLLHPDLPPVQVDA